MDAKWKKISPSKGICQGDLLSPYIFVLRMDKLSYLICDSIDENKWTLIKASKNGPLISPLMSVDDLILLREALEIQIEIIMDCLIKFGKMSGQKVNIEKINILFSRNVSQDTKNCIV